MGELFNLSMARRRPRGVAWIDVSAACDNPARGNFGVGGDRRAMVCPDEEETGDDRFSLEGLDICNKEK